ncbi:hypothetical protein AGMMS49949_00780 [Alphaproteobacteria bacterium]|nr:hypothetical protein AGMMS49949_00780 [Alphaproteobacteria bacterium]GHS95800.1 hypothetical protein AGMMS50296_0970 [Alphaproteobacteria bacterium]
MFHKEIKTKEAKKKLEEFVPKFKSGAKGEGCDGDSASRLAQFQYFFFREAGARCYCVYGEIL